MLEGGHSDRQGRSLTRVVRLALADVDITLGRMRRGEGVVVLNKNSRICDIFIFLNKSLSQTELVCTLYFYFDVICTFHVFACLFSFLELRPLQTISFMSKTIYLFDFECRNHSTVHTSSFLPVLIIQTLVQL